MKQYLPLLATFRLFDGIAETALPPLLSHLNAQVLSCHKGQIVFYQDEPIRFVAAVLAGCVQVIHGDIHGTHTITGTFGPGELVGESFACALADTWPVNVIASDESRLLLLEHKQLLYSSNQQAHVQLMTNLLHIIARKNMILSQKLEIMSQRTTRDKLMAYLHMQASAAHDGHFIIPFDRQGLADYLGVERSAMSTELNKLKKAGLIDFHKNSFRVF